jgi:hypothetical protein
VSAAPLFTVLLPVHRSPELLDCAIDSVLSQTEDRLELLIVCDGAPTSTADLARDRAARDPRVRALVFPKGERHGEAHRDRALRDARGTLVAQLGDDDLWFPDYLRALAALLDEVDFGNLIQVDLQPDGTLGVHSGDLADPDTRHRMLTGDWNFFGPTFCGYRLDAYRALPVGWSPAPPGVWTDLHMWRKFLSAPGLSFGTRFVIEGVKLQASDRDADPTERTAEHRKVIARFATEEGREALREEAWRAMYARVHDHARNLEQQRDLVQRDAVEMVERLTVLEPRAAADAHEVEVLRRRVERLRQRVRDLRRRNRRLDDRITSMERSWSWRLTALLRHARPRRSASARVSRPRGE